MSGPHLRFLPAQWISGKKLLSPLFKGVKPRTDIISDNVLDPLYGRQVDDLRGYVLWRLVLDLPDSFSADDDCVRVGRFLVNSGVNPKRWAESEATGLAQAVKRFKDTRPLYEQIFDELHVLDERMDREGTRDDAQELLVVTIARFNLSPPSLWFSMDEWEGALQRKGDDALLEPFLEGRAFAETLLREGCHFNPRFDVIAARSHRTPVISDSAAARSEIVRRRAKKKK